MYVNKGSDTLLSIPIEYFMMAVNIIKCPHEKVEIFKKQL